MLPIPIPRCPINIRPGEMSDLSFIDSLQKLHRKQVGWMPTASLEQKIQAGHVLIAEEVNCHWSLVTGQEQRPRFTSSLTSDKGPVTNDSRLGYLIACDQYFKRDDVGIIYQLNVAPGHQRGYVGAALLKAQFERSAYGCRLYCCWCAQDIQANHFWESMGFVPLAFRTGGAGRKVRNAECGMQNEFTPHSALCTPQSPRVHIFWQKRIDEDDCTTPWWFPSKTNGGSIREDRIVLPIPPGTHWSQVTPLLLPQQRQGSGVGGEGSEKKSRVRTVKKIEQPRSGRRNGLWFNIPRSDEPAAPPVKAKVARSKARTDPRLSAAARELRDRYLQRINADESLLGGGGKYDVNRLVESPARPMIDAIRPAGLLQAA